MRDAGRGTRGRDSKRMFGDQQILRFAQDDKPASRVPRPASRVPHPTPRKPGCRKPRSPLHFRAMFDELSEKLEATFARLRGRGILSEADIKEGLREVRRVLLEADVNFQLTREFLERVEKKAVGANVLSTVSPGQQLV